MQPDEQGVVLRFGAFNRTTLPGLQLSHALAGRERCDARPSPGSTGSRSAIRSGAGAARCKAAATAGRDVLEESLMLTGDENIIDIDFAVFWRIRDASRYLFNTRNPRAIVQGVAESSMREVIGRTPIQPALTECARKSRPT